MRVIFLSIVSIFLAPAGLADSAVLFNRDVRPILSENCFLCHGPDKGTRKGKLRLDIREEALNKKAIVPGDVEASGLVKRVFTDDEDDHMPPAESGKKLSAAQKEILKRWVAQGAEYQPHWAYVELKRPATPEVGDRAWAANPIDAFILKELEARKMGPSAQADRRALLRRVSLDLTGLPPTPEEARAFVADRSPDAYEKQVERLLASPRFGERMAVWWLDLARYADTVGYHGDQNQNVFPYRDYVIDSFNANKPFDQFAIEQLAGDLLPNPTVEQRVATGFNRLNMMTREGGAQPKEYLAKYAADRVRTVATTFLGATMGCAECHDHKYDPILTKDFYSMAAFFADVKQWGVYHDYAYTPNPDLRGFSNDHPFPPEMEVESPYLKRRLEKLRARMKELSRGAIAKVRGDEKLLAAFEEWRGSVVQFLKDHPEGWLTPAVEAARDGVSIDEDATVVVSGKAKKGDSIQVALDAPAGWVAAIKLELIPHEMNDWSVAREGASSMSLRMTAAVRSKNSAGKERDAALPFYHADADYKEARYANGFEIIGVVDQWRTSSAQAKAKQTAVYLVDGPRRLSAGEKLVVTLRGDHVGAFRVSISPLRFHPPGSKVDQRVAAALASETEGRSEEQWEAAAGSYLMSGGYDKEAFGLFKLLYREVLECRGGQARTLVTEAWEPRVTRVLRRGNWQDESGEVVQPAVPHFLPQPRVDSRGRRLTRLDLARWIVSRENPLTARTFVNRMWKMFFGNGISAVVDDLGAQGEWPTHPDLLDWLAVEFRESGWDVKHVVRLLVTSATYRQTASLRRDLREVDPNNRLLASQNPRRLDAEFVRDNALFVSGLLNLEMGGPSAHPYQPAGYYANLQFPDRDYVAERDERQYRRGVYMHWQRTFLHPMLANFDAPSREECTAIRVVSNTPQQALTLLNDPTFVEAARVFAGRLLTDGPVKTDAERLGLAYERALARPIKERERESLRRFLEEQRTYYRGHPEDAAKVVKVGFAPAAKGVDVVEHAAWANVCRVILNLHEGITRY